MEEWKPWIRQNKRISGMVEVSVIQGWTLLASIGHGRDRVQRPVRHGQLLFVSSESPLGSLFSRQPIEPELIHTVRRPTLIRQCKVS
jgi:hypothetical protein